MSLKHRRRKSHKVSDASVSGFDMTSLEGRRDFVFGAWKALAAWGWGAYMLYGRGAILIEGTREGVELPKYVGPRSNFGDAEFDAEVAEATREYDPEDEIVVVFALQDFGCALGRYGVDEPNETPPMCYARLRKDDVLH